jgi:hypothetical protein
MFGYGSGFGGGRRFPLGCTRTGVFIGLYAALVLAIPLASTQEPQVDAVVAAPTSPTPREVAEPAGSERDREVVRKLAGVWQRYERGVEGDPLRFYYFHGDGKGLYRYGKTGLNNTHSFDYDVEGDVLRLRFRKTDRVHDVRFSIDEDEHGRHRLTLHGDPEETGVTRYVRETEGPIEHMDGPPPSGHMWIDLQRYGTGGCGFHFYQLRPAGIDGRGVGWFHRGDFDDWSTESLVYRITGNTLELWFPLTGQHETTRFTLTREGEQRWMMLGRDPRDFWHEHRYLDAGPSFGMRSQLECGAGLATVAGSAHILTL